MLNLFRNELFNYLWEDNVLLVCEKGISDKGRFKLNVIWFENVSSFGIPCKSINFNGSADTGLRLAFVIFVDMVGFNRFSCDISL
jgi:hypothetical protein